MAWPYLEDSTKLASPNSTGHNLRFERLWAPMRSDLKRVGEAGEGIQLLVQPIHALLLAYLFSSLERSRSHSG
jgi:hypothetical protein